MMKSKMIVANRNIYIVSLVQLIILCPLEALKMCTDSTRLRFTGMNTSSPNAEAISLTTNGAIACALNCLKRKQCLSITYDAISGECQLKNSTTLTSTFLKEQFKTAQNDATKWQYTLAGPCVNHSYPLIVLSDGTNRNQYFCKYTGGCIGVPVIKNGHYKLIEVSCESIIGTILSYTCDPGYLPAADVTCQEDGTWSSGSCILISSCRTVKQYRPDSKDGEYWLHLVNFDNYKIRIYCHNMFSSSPAEYLTLAHVNYGIYPKLANRYCKSYSGLIFGCRGKGGEVWFSKIRLNIDTLEVNIKDRTFAKLTNYKLDYGVAFDCYTHHDNKKMRCGTRGKFTIDLRETGLRVKPEQEWQTVGYTGIITKVTVEANGTIVRLQCGGFPGGCRPKRGLYLSPFWRI